MTRLAVLGLLAWTACADDTVTDPGPFDASAQNFIDVACTGTCTSGTPDKCRTDVAADLADAKAKLDADGQARCAHCLDVKAEVIPQLASCMPTAAQNADVFAACDLDPTTDFDGDGDSTDDYDEACAGFP